MAKSKKSSFSPRDIAITAFVAVAVVGATSLLMTSKGSSLTAAVLNASPSTVATTTSAFHTISYSGADKGRYGAEVNVYPQGKVPNVVLTMYSTSAEIKRLQSYTKGGAVAYVSYEVYAGVVGPNTGISNNPALFSSAGSTALKVKGTTMTGRLPLDFAIHMIPGTYYTVVVYVKAADSSFSETSNVYILSSNEYSKCELKG